MLTGLNIENFKGIRTGEMSGLTQVNILVGLNNSGKSTVLDALVLLRCPFALRDYLAQDGLEQVLSRRTTRDDLNYKEFLFRLDGELPTTIKVDLTNGYTVTSRWSFPNTIVRIEVENERSSWTGKDLIQDSDVFYREPSRMVFPIGRDSGGVQLEPKNLLHLAKSHLLDPGVIKEPYIETAWGRLIADRRDRYVRDTVNDIYQLNVESFNMSPFPVQTRLVASLPNHSVALDWLGDGLRYAFNILSVGALMRDTSLMIEELETHQHPESLRKLTQVLFKLAKQRNLQLFLTTHSMEFIGFALESAEEEGVDTALHHLSLDQEGNFSSRAISQPDAKLLLDIGHDPRFHYKYVGVDS